MSSTMKCCRICGKEDVSTLKPIFSTYHKPRRREIIISCLPVQISKNDGLPQYMCQTCFRKVSSCFETQKLCLDTYAKLKAKYDIQVATQNNGIKTENNIEVTNPTEEYIQVPKEIKKVVPKNSDHFVQYKDVLIVVQKFPDGHDMLKVILVPDTPCDRPISERVAEGLKASIKRIAEEKTLYKKRNHIKGSGYYCFACKRHYLDKNKKLDHYTRKHPELVKLCELCNTEVCGNEEVQTKHRNEHYDVKVITVCQYKPGCRGVSARNQVTRVLKCANTHPAIPDNLRLTVENSLKAFISKDCPYEITKHFLPSQVVETNTCPVCYHKAPDEDDYERHMIKAHSPLVLKPKCEHCDKRIKAYGLEEHIEEKHGTGKILICAICDKDYHETGREQPHMFRNEIKICTYCNQELLGDKELAEHVYSTHKVSEFHCEICNKYFKNKLTLINHFYLLHSDYPQPKCKYCKKTYSNEANLRAHYKMQHTVHEKCICEMCGAMIEKPKLKTHIHGHMLSDQKKMCPFCNTLVNLRTYKLHKYKHEHNVPCGSNIRRNQQHPLLSKKKKVLNLTGNNDGLTHFIQIVDENELRISMIKHEIINEDVGTNIKIQTTDSINSVVSIPHTSITSVSCSICKVPIEISSIKEHLAQHKENKDGNNDDITGIKIIDLGKGEQYSIVHDLRSNNSNTEESHKQFYTIVNLDQKETPIFVREIDLIDKDFLSDQLINTDVDMMEQFDDVFCEVEVTD